MFFPPCGNENPSIYLVMMILKFYFSRYDILSIRLLDEFLSISEKVKFIGCTQGTKTSTGSIIQQMMKGPFSKIIHVPKFSIEETSIYIERILEVKSVPRYFVDCIQKVSQGNPRDIEGLALCFSNFHAVEKS